MSALKFIKYVALFLMLLFFVPIGVGDLVSTIKQTQELKDADSNVEGEVITPTTGVKLNNPNPFNREFEICSGAYSSRFYAVEEHSSYIREIYDKFGIQIYLLTYSIDFSDGINETKQETKDEINAWLEENGKDPYGIYYILSGYDRGWSDERFKVDGIYENYHKSVVSGYRVYGSEVDKWWNHKVQQAFEDSIEKGEYYITEGSDCYKDFVKALSSIDLDVTASDKLKDVAGVTSSDESPDIVASLFIFTIFAVVPIGIVIIIIVKDINKVIQIRKLAEEEEARRQHEETQRILNTPIKTLEEEYAEELKDKYIK